MKRTLTLFASDMERAVYGLTATCDESAALLAQLEALLPGAARPRRPLLTSEAVAEALAATGGSVKAAAKRLGYARSTVRAAHDRGNGVPL